MVYVDSPGLPISWYVTNNFAKISKKRTDSAQECFGLQMNARRRCALLNLSMQPKSNHSVEKDWVYKIIATVRFVFVFLLPILIVAYARICIFSSDWIWAIDFGWRWDLRLNTMNNWTCRRFLRGVCPPSQVLARSFSGRALTHSLKFTQPQYCFLWQVKYCGSSGDRQKRMSQNVRWPVLQNRVSLPLYFV